MLTRGVLYSFSGVLGKAPPGSGASFVLAVYKRVGKFVD